MWKLIILLATLTFTLSSAKSLKAHQEILRNPEDGRVENPESEDDEIKKLSCTHLSKVDGTNSSSSIRWFRINPDDRETEMEEVTNDDILGISVNGGDLNLGSTALNSGDIYRCKLDNERFGDFEIFDSKDFRGRQFRVDKFPRSLSVIEGEDLKISCFVMNRSANGFDMNDVAIRWYMWDKVDDLEFETSSTNCSKDSMEGSLWKEITVDIGGDDREEPHIRLLTRDGISKGILKIEDAVRSDRRGFKCVAYNVTGEPFDCSESVTFVRVKDKFAALWPFLGIVAEVVFLSVCILFFEKRRAAKGLEEEEEDENHVGGSNPNGDKNTVRQRK